MPLAVPSEGCGIPRETRGREGAAARSADRRRRTIPNAIRINPLSVKDPLVNMVLRPAIRNARPGEDHVGIDSPIGRSFADR